jgi:hypothetical protein
MQLIQEADPKQQRQRQHGRAAPGALCPGRRHSWQAPPLLPLQMWCKEHARLSCECMRQCHAHYCNEENGDPAECVSFREPHSE